MTKKLYRPSRDGEGFLWKALLEKGPLTVEGIKSCMEEVPYNLDWDYVQDCLDFMIKDEAVIEEEGVFMIEPELLKGTLRLQEEYANRPIYYCEQCLHVRGELAVMWKGPTKDGDDRLHCGKCQGEWKVNQGYVRHLVSLKLQHYRKLADRLGILEIEEEDHE